MNRYKRLGLNSLFVFIGNVGAKLIGFIMLPFYTKWLSKSDYGLSDISSISISFLIPYLTFGLCEAIFLFPKGKSQGIQQEYFSTAFWIILFIEFLFCIVLIVTPYNLLTYIFPKELLKYIPLMCVLLVLSSIQQFIQQFCRAIDKMKIFSFTGIIYALFLAVLAILLIPSYGLTGYFVSLIIAQCITIIYIFWRIKCWKYVVICINRKMLDEMIKYSIPLIPNATMWWVVNSINRPLMLKYIGLDSVGIYAVANKFPSLLNMIFMIFFSALQISVLEEFYKKDYKIFYNRIFRLVLFSQILFCFVFVILGPYIFSILVDSNYYAAMQYVPLLCLGVLLANLATFVGTTFTAIRKTKYFFYSSIVAALIAIVANMLLIPKFGIYGACISIVLSQLGMFLMRWKDSFRYVNFINFPKLGLTFLSLVLALLSFYLIEYRSISMAVIIFLFIVFWASNFDIYRLLVSFFKSKIR